MNDNLYNILGVNKNASKDEIKKAYKKNVLKCHPDKSTSVNSNDDFIKLNSAYQILINDESRMRYDAMHENNQEKFMEYMKEHIKKMINKEEIIKLFGCFTDNDIILHHIKFKFWVKGHARP